MGAGTHAGPAAGKRNTSPGPSAMDTEPEVMRFQAELLEDPDDPGSVILDLGLELCERMGWHAGDILEWIDNKDGTWTLKKKTQD